MKKHEGLQDEGEDIVVQFHPRADVPRLILEEGQLAHALVVVAFFLERLRAEAKR